MNTLILALKLIAILCCTVLVSGFVLTVSVTGFVWVAVPLVLGALASVEAVDNYKDATN